MAKFGKKIRRNRVSEWRDKYCYYSRLKRLLRPIVSNSTRDERYKRKSFCLGPIRKIDFNNGSGSSSDFNSISEIDFFDLVSGGIKEKIPRDVLKTERKFYDEFGSEFKKVLRFYEEKVTFFQKQINILLSHMRYFDSQNIKKKENGKGVKKNKFEQNKALKESRRSNLTKKDLKHCARELSRGLKLLENFRELNSAAFYKILKKHDKFSFIKESFSLVFPVVKSSSLYKKNLTDDLFLKLEDGYVYLYSKKGRYQETKKELSCSLPKDTMFESFLVGLFLGMSIGLSIISFTQFKKSKINFGVISIWRFFILLSIYVICWGLNKIIFENKQINYYFIMQVPIKNRISAVNTLFIGTLSLFLVLLTFCITLVMGSQRVVNIAPVVYLLLFVVIFVLPFKIFMYQTRLNLIKILLRVFKIPFIHIKFIDFFVMDQITSMQSISYDFNSGLCYLFSGSFLVGGTKCNIYQKYSIIFVSVFAFIIRGAQCLRRFKETKKVFPHVVNANKYFLAAVSSIFTRLFISFERKSFSICFLLFSTASSLATFTWDVVIDWGLLRSKEKCFLRDKIMFSPPVYWAAIFINFALRMTWISVFFAKGYNLDTIHRKYLFFTLAVLEIVRRSQWNIFRFENEHLNNVGDFRATDIIPLGDPPVNDLSNSEVN